MNLENTLPATSEHPIVRRPLVVGDFDVWYQPCAHCGYDTAKSRVLDDPRCWKCGRRIQRDFSDRALKKGIDRGNDNAQ